MDGIKLFALSKSKGLGLEIASQLNLPLSNCSTLHFADGETMIDFSESVRGQNVFLVQSTSRPVDLSYMELFIAIDALKRASAKTINIIMPYCGYSRQDRKKKPREPITARLVADLLITSGANYLLSIDLHVLQIQGFYSIPMDNVSAIGVIAEYFLTKKLNDIVVVSPDHNGIDRARNLAEALGVSIAIIDKRREAPNVSEALALIGDVRNKNVIIVDDLIDTGGTVINACNMLKAFQSKDIYVACTHAVFSNDAEDRLANSCAKEIIVTNTIDFTPKTDKIKVLSIAPLIAKVMEKIISEKSINDL